MRALSIIASVVFLTILGACIPHVPHGPRVEPGTRYSLTASVSHAPSLQDEQMSIAPSLYLGGRRGWAGESGMAGSIGLQVPVLALPVVLFAGEELEDFWRIIILDTYLQPRRARPGGIDYGVGALVSPGIAMPYLQVGRADEGGVYTTQGFAFTFGSFNRVIYWTPSLSVRTIRPDGARIVDFFAHATVGWHQSDVRETRRDWAAGVGVAIDFVRRR